MYFIVKTSNFLLRRLKIHGKYVSCYFSNTEAPDDERHGLARATRILKNDVTKAICRDVDLYRNECDIAIIGGGIMGCAIAYWLQRRTHKGFRIVVIDRDPEFTKLATSSSLGGMRQQFALHENIQMSLFSAEFLRNIKTHLSVLDMEPPDVQFNPQGYLCLASEKDAQQFEINYNLQKSLGVSVELLTAGKLKNEFPWLNTDEIALGCLGLENEGWFDPWALLTAFKRKALSMGTRFINAQVIGIDGEDDSKVKYFPVDSGINHQHQHLQRLWINAEDDEIEPIEFKTLVLAAGSLSGQVGLLANIGSGPGLLNHPIPVEPRKHYVYVYNATKGPSIKCPLVLDSNGVYFRREGLSGNFIGGRSPLPSEDSEITNLDVDYAVFDSEIWPALARRVPSFEALKLKKAWAALCDYNTFDENGIVGRHPFYANLFLATGFSGHGIQHAPAVGRAVTELIVDSRYTTIDLSRLGFQRIIDNKPLYVNE